MKSGNTGKYVLYALGEIALVVIGILIALAINNNHENRLTREKEQIYLLGLRDDFQASKNKLNELLEINKGNYKGAKQIMDYIINKNELPTERQFSELLYHTFSSDIYFNPNNSFLNEMINSGSLKDLSNTNLRRQLTNWISTLEDISKQENDLNNQRAQVLDLLRTDKYSKRTILNLTKVSQEMGLPKGENMISNLKLLNSVTFENNILMFILTSYATESNHYIPLMQELEAILEMINTEINQK